jgi:hypothetical protein
MEHISAIIEDVFSRCSECDHAIGFHDEHGCAALDCHCNIGVVDPEDYLPEVLEPFYLLSSE